MMARPISKAELLESMATSGQMTRRQAATALDAVVAAVTEALKAGKAVTLPGLAKFETRDRPDRQVRNVATGTMIDKPADRTVKVSPSSTIKAAVNGGS